MARVDWAIPCRYAEENAGLATIVGAGIDRLHVSELPGQVGVLIALRIVLREDELGHEHEIAFTLYDPTMAEVAHLDGHFSAEAHPAKEPGWETGMITPTAHNFAVTEYGTYSLEVLIDGHSEKTIPLLIREPQATPQPDASP